MSRNSESGYALLFVYSMAAVLAIMLFMEIPRAAFEAQRDREQLLIDRGQQYSRAVALYVRKFNTYPPSIDALDNTQNIRFLRGHYVDPMTGKNEWRLIHVGPGGVFTDSLVYGKKKDGDQPSAPQNFITELQQTGGNQAGENQGGVNIAARQRPSDQAGSPGDPNNPQSNLPPPQLGLNNGQQPGLTPFGTPQVDINGQPVAIPPAAQPGFQGQTQPGQIQSGLNGFPPGIQPPQGLQSGFGSTPFQPPQSGLNAGTTTPPQPAGANIINQLLTTPRPGGMPGFGQPGQNGAPTIDQYGNPVPANPLIAASTGAAAAAATTSTPAASPQVVGGGIAGVASKREQQGIKVYNEKKKYNEWEFVYDISKDPSRGGMGGQQPASTSQAGQQPQPQQAQQNPQQSQQPFQQQQQIQPQQTQQPFTPPPVPNLPGLSPPPPSQ